MMEIRDAKLHDWSGDKADEALALAQGAVAKATTIADLEDVWMTDGTLDVHVQAIAEPRDADEKDYTHVVNIYQRLEWSDGVSLLGDCYGGGYCYIS